MNMNIYERIRALFSLLVAIHSLWVRRQQKPRLLSQIRISERLGYCLGIQRQDSGHSPEERKLRFLEERPAKRDLRLEGKILSLKPKTKCSLSVSDP
jgi:hypothetical protein